tara:strand:- start:123 stop:698 length:576 start_codon:yes stop_codon:yes gene_type:complete
MLMMMLAVIVGLLAFIILRLQLLAIEVSSLRDEVVLLLTERQEEEYRTAQSPVFYDDVAVLSPTAVMADAHDTHKQCDVQIQEVTEAEDGESQTDEAEAQTGEAEAPYSEEYELDLEADELSSLEDESRLQEELSSTDSEGAFSVDAVTLPNTCIPPFGAYITRPSPVRQIVMSPSKSEQNGAVLEENDVA